MRRIQNMKVNEGVREFDLAISCRERRPWRSAIAHRRGTPQRAFPTDNRISGHPQATRRHRRGGYLYLAVMIVSTLIGIVGLSAMTIARAKLQSTQDERDRYEARILAMSAIENGLAEINDNSNWRSTYTNSVEFPATPLSVGNGTIACELIDVDGDLDDGDGHSAFLYGIGRVGNAVQVRRVEIEPAGTDEMKIVLGSWVDSDAL